MTSSPRQHRGEIALSVVPDADDPDAATIFVDGHVGERPYRFRLDTGAARSCLGMDEYTGTHPVAGEHRTSGLFAAAEQELIVVPSIRVGPIAAREITVARVSLTDPALANLLGMDLLKNHRLHVRFDTDRIEVDPFDAPEETHELVLDRGHHAYVAVDLGAATGSAVWDSGAGITIVDLAFARRHPVSFHEVGRSTGTDATGTALATPVFALTGARIGGCLFPPHRCAGVDLAAVNATIARPMDLILGYSTLALANWWLDVPGRRWAVTGLHSAG